MTELTVYSDLTRDASEEFNLDRTAIADTPDTADAACTDFRRLADTRFRDLMGTDAWSRLPAVVRERFSRHVEPGAARIFAGTVTETRLSRIGRIVGNIARLVGGPLPFTDGATGPSNVVVTESAELGGQIWTRTYARPGHFPQTINSVKRFAGPTGLEEYLGFGLVMRLTVHVEAQALVFRSAGYDLMLGPFRVPLPRFLSPGRCTITHRAHGPTRFSFALALDHPWAGRLATQVAYFEEITP